MKLRKRDYLRQIRMGSKYRMARTILIGSVLFCFMFPHIQSSAVRAADAVRTRGIPKIDVDDPLYRNYPKRFDGMGYIDAIKQKRIIIDDTSYPMASAISFHTPRRSGAPISSFRVGQYVAYLLNDSKQIKHLYLIKWK